ncbi:uncharacterized protein LDX57_007134 [Aspergillus melleus]|uniref:uncharacterized protein n=1 Tax=Aspergillus melleus TaxID=138277 RepID=UPI001E8DBB19|nr:uncharacterized protein LDX57_007134 [Aspergillus melleus]KAH8429472.1 hypothetical protein LDX57_007134 [Aspergillus melleus]
MVKLHDFPTELLAHIVSYVGVDGPLDGSPYIGGLKDDWESIGHDEEVEIEALCSLCLVSRKFRALAQPVLFEHFVEEHWFGDYQTLVTFTRTVTLRPDLGACVRTIDTRSTGSERPPMGMPGMPHPLSIKSEDLEVFKQAVRDLQVSSEEQARWFKAVENRDFSVFMALLLSKTPNIHTLVLPAGEFFVKPVSHLFTQIPSFLSKLKSIVLAGDSLYSGYDIAIYRDFLSLPLLKDVIVDYGDLVEAKCPSFAPGSLPIQSLFFKLCHIDAGSMQTLVRGCKELTSFALTNFARNPRHGRYDHGDIKQFNAAQLHTELLAHKDTLKKLHFEENYPDSTKIGSLRDFPVLDQISIQHQLLPPKPQFPPSLKTLFITDCNTSIRDMAQHIADDC